jgi:hypothetical protein
MSGLLNRLVRRRSESGGEERLSAIAGNRVTVVKQAASSCIDSYAGQYCSTVLLGELRRRGADGPTPINYCQRR